MIPGASAQVFAGGFAEAAGIETTMVPFDSDAPGVTALAGGHIDVHVAVPASYKALLEAGKIKVVGVAGEERMTTFPDIPTLKEQDVDLVIGSFHGLFAPSGVPEDVVARLESALQQAMQDESVTEQMANIGLGPVYMDRKAAQSFIAGQDASYRKLINQMGMMHESKK
jgi:tripartite-type tricarboxylate transporter receptor subunit TctC